MFLLLASALQFLLVCEALKLFVHRPGILKTTSRRVVLHAVGKPLMEKMKIVTGGSYAIAGR
jgi:hypothetical protein